MLHTKAKHALVKQLDEVVNFSVAATYGSLAVESHISAIGDEETILLGPPVSFPHDKSTAGLMRQHLIGYEGHLARYLYLAIFSFFEEYFYACLEELIKFHSGTTRFFLPRSNHPAIVPTEFDETIEREVRILRQRYDRRHLLRYQNSIVELRSRNFTFPSGIVSHYGGSRLKKAIANRDIKSFEFLDVLKDALQLDVPQKTVDTFHSIRKKRNKIAHGDTISISLHEVVLAKNTVVSLANLIDTYLVERLFLIEDPWRHGSMPKRR